MHLQQFRLPSPHLSHLHTCVNQPASLAVQRPHCSPRHWLTGMLAEGCPTRDLTWRVALSTDRLYQQSTVSAHRHPPPWARKPASTPLHRLLIATRGIEGASPGGRQGTRRRLPQCTCPQYVAPDVNGLRPPTLRDAISQVQPPPQRCHSTGGYGRAECTGARTNHCRGRPPGG